MILEFKILQLFFKQFIYVLHELNNLQLNDLTLFYDTQSYYLYLFLTHYLNAQSSFYKFHNNGLNQYNHHLIFFSMISIDQLNHLFFIVVLGCLFKVHFSFE